PPGESRRKVDLRIGLLPGAMPELDRGGFVFGAVGAEGDGSQFSKVVMPGQSRPKDGVASALLCLGIHAFPSALTKDRGWPGQARP
ncbi:hypothetical protein ABTK14_22355, partial [Acinetobacter baumannii]